MSDYPMLISNKLHSFRNFTKQTSYLKQGILYYYYNQVYLFSIHPTRIMYIQQ